METREYTVYKFDELSDEGKEKAIERYYDINVDHDWWEHIFDDAERIGLKITSFDLDRGRHAKGRLTQGIPAVITDILSEHGPDCDTYKFAIEWKQRYRNEAARWLWELRKNYPDERNELDDYLDSRQYDDLEHDFLRELLEEYSCILQREYDYLTSEEAVTESFVANEYDFTEDGRID